MSRELMNVVELFAKLGQDKTKAQKNLYVLYQIVLPYSLRMKQMLMGLKRVEGDSELELNKL